jgi:MarR family transcriptional regulator, temperature-dependent positive regulator of motility
MFDNCLYFNTAALARQLEREWSAAFKPFGLTPAQAFLLRTILHRPGLLQCELAEAMTISRPTATRALDGLAAKQLIERRDSERDGREYFIFPTTTAEQLHVALNEASAKVSKRLKKQLSDEIFSDVVSKIKELRTTLK